MPIISGIEKLYSVVIWFIIKYSIIFLNYKIEQFTEPIINGDTIDIKDQIAQIKTMQTKV